MIGTPQMIDKVQRFVRVNARVDCASIASQLRLNWPLISSQLCRT